MAKRKADLEKTVSRTKMDIDGEDESDNDSEIDVELDFLGLNPEIDFLGLKMLIKQLFDVDNELIELSQLADLILSQSDHVGTAVKCDGEESDPYSFITVLNVDEHKDKPAMRQLISYLSSRLSNNKQLGAALTDPKTRLGLLLSERLINMPHQVVPPMYNMLQKEMSAGGKAFSFTHLLIVTKTYTEEQSSLDAEEDRPQKKARAGKDSELFYFHPEDEVFRKHAVADESFQYQKESEASNSDSRRAFSEAGYRPQGHAILLDASKLDTAIQAVTQYFEGG